jgi:hypothetical protein
MFVLPCNPQTNQCATDTTHPSSLPTLTPRRPAQVQAAIASGQRPEVPADAPEKVAALIGQCCATDAAKRPTMVRVVSTLEAVLAAQGDDDEQQSE